MMTWRKKRFSPPSGKGRVGGLVKDMLTWGKSADTGTRVMTRGLRWEIASGCFVDSKVERRTAIPHIQLCVIVSCVVISSFLLQAFSKIVLGVTA